MTTNNKIYKLNDGTEFRIIVYGWEDEEASMNFLPWQNALITFDDNDGESVAPAFRTCIEDNNHSIIPEFNSACLRYMYDNCEDLTSEDVIWYFNRYRSVEDALRDYFEVA